MESGFRVVRPQMRLNHDRLENLREHHRFGVNTGDHLKLDQGFGPVSKCAMKLEEKNSQLGILGVCPDLVLQFDQRFVRLAGGDVFLGSHG